MCRGTGTCSRGACVLTTSDSLNMLPMLGFAGVDHDKGYKLQLMWGRREVVNINKILQKCGYQMGGFETMYIRDGS